MLRSSTSVLTEDSLLRLSELGYAESAAKAGFIKLLVTSYSSSSEDGTATTSVPTHTDSIAALRFIGLSKAASQAAYQRFCNAEDDAADVIDFAIGTAMNGYDAFGDDDAEWVEAMRSMGVNKVLAGRIMTPGFESLRRSKTAREWVLITMQQRDRIVGLAPHSQGPISDKRRMAASKGAKSGESSKSGSKSAQSKGEDASKKEPNPIVINAEVNQTIAIGETLLMAGGPITDLSKAFRAGNVPGRQYTLDRMYVGPPSDFSTKPNVVYFTQQEELATEFTMYARGRLGETEVPVGMIYVVVPDDLLSGATSIFGSGWSEFVWWNRLGAQIPEHLKVYEHSDILIGPMLRKTNNTVKKFHNAGHDHTVLVPHRLSSGEAAIQHVFRGDAIMDQVDSRCRAWLLQWILPAEKKFR